MSAQLNKSGQIKVRDLQALPSDHRLYRYVVLANGLRALLIQNNRASNTSVRLTVEAGSFDEPGDLDKPGKFDGLAHFLEHMLFKGNHKFKDPSEYQAYIHQHGGAYNGITMHDKTYYDIQIGHEHLDGVLDRLSEFLANPLFLETSAAGEIKIIDEEFNRNKSQDVWREIYVNKQVINPKHPERRNNIGNKDSFKISDPNFFKELMLALKKFHADHYVPNKMLCVVESGQSLDELQSVLTKHFNKIRTTKEVTLKQALPLRYHPDSLGMVIEQESLEGEDFLKLEFIVPGSETLENYYATQFISFLVENSSEGCLEDKLKQHKLIKEFSSKGKKFSTSCSFVDSKQMIFSFGYPIMNTSQSNIDAIMSLTLSYLQSIKKHCITLEYFKELQDIGQLEYTMNASTIHEENAVNVFTHHLLNFPLDKFFVGSAVLKDTPFPKERIMDIFAHLNPTNMRKVICRSTPIEKQALKLEPCMKVNFSHKPDLQSKNLKESSEITFKLPEKNPFFPQTFDLIERTPNLYKFPQLIHSKDLLRCWYSQDYKFNTPQVITYCLFEEDLSAKTHAHQIAIGLYFFLIMDEINKKLARHISCSNASFDLDSEHRGWVFTLSGYSHKHDQIWLKIMDLIAHFEFKRDEFENKRLSFIDIYRNKKTDTLLESSKDYLETLLDNNEHTVEQNIEALIKLDFDFVKDCARTFFKDSRLELYTHGNLSVETVVKLAEDIHKTLKFSNKETFEYPHRIVSLPQKSSHSYTFKSPTANENDAVTLFWQASDKFAHNLYLLKIIEKIIKPKYYKELRDKQELAYAIGCGLRAIENSYGLYFFIESSVYDASLLLTKTLDFLNDKQLLTIAPEDFESIKTSLNKMHKRKRTKFSSLEDYASFFATDMHEGDYNFKESMLQRNPYSSITLSQVQEYFRLLIQDEKRLVIIKAIGKNLKQENLKETIEIEDIVKFKAQQSVIPDVSVLEYFKALQGCTLNQEMNCVSTVLTYCFGNYKPSLPNAIVSEIDQALQKSLKA